MMISIRLQTSRKSGALAPRFMLEILITQRYNDGPTMMIQERASRKHCRSKFPAACRPIGPFSFKHTVYFLKSRETRWLLAAVFSAPTITAVSGAHQRRCLILMCILHLFILSFLSVNFCFCCTPDQFCPCCSPDHFKYRHHKTAGGSQTVVKQPSKSKLEVHVII